MTEEKLAERLRALEEQYRQAGERSREAATQHRLAESQAEALHGAIQECRYWLAQIKKGGETTTTGALLR